MSWNRCPGCSMISVGTDDYCPRCGEHLTIMCPQCGLTWRFWEGHKYCPKCGTEVKNRKLMVLSKSC
jgi:predicted amidophosphoribosyltransferase